VKGEGVKMRLSICALRLQGKICDLKFGSYNWEFQTDTEFFKWNKT